MARDLRALRNDIARRVQHNDAGKTQSATGMRAAPDRHAIRVAGHKPYAVDRNAEPFADQLGEAGLVTLAVGHGADDDLHGAVG